MTTWKQTTDANQNGERFWTGPSLEAMTAHGEIVTVDTDTDGTTTTVHVRIITHGCQQALEITAEVAGLLAGLLNTALPAIATTPTEA